jgi:hypothetical protein
MAGLLGGGRKAYADGNLKKIGWEEPCIIRFALPQEQS